MIARNSPKGADRKREEAHGLRRRKVGRSAVPTAGLGHVGLAHHGGSPSVRTVGRGDTLAVQGLGDLGEGLAFREQRPDLRPPSIVPVVAPDVGQSNVLGDELPPADLRIG